LQTAAQKIEQLENEIGGLISEVQRLKEIEQYARRLKIDFEEYKQLSHKERDRMVRLANEGIMGSLIPVISNFERALKFMRVENPSKEMQMMTKGVEMIFQSLKATLENEGLEEIPTRVGELFDPFAHEVVDKVQDVSLPENAIVEVVEAGYRFQKKVLKPSRVTVAVHPSTNGAGNDQAEDLR